MHKYIARRFDNTLLLVDLTVGSTDSTGIPPDGSVLTDELWGVMGELCGATGLKQPDYDNKIVSTIAAILAKKGVVVKATLSTTEAATEMN